MSREDLASLIVTDPDIVDEGIDVSGLRTTTDTNPLLLANLEPGIKFDPTQQSVYSDLLNYFSGGLPMFPESTETAKVITPQDTGGGEQATTPVVTQPTIPSDTTTTIPIDPGTFTAESLDQSFAGEEGPIVTQPGREAPITVQDMGDGTTTTIPGRPKIMDQPGVTTLSSPQIPQGFEGYYGSNQTVTAEDTPESFIQKIKGFAQGALDNVDIGKAIAMTALNAAVGKPVSIAFNILAALLPKENPINKFNNEYAVGGDLYKDIIQDSTDPDLGKRLADYSDSLRSGNIPNQDPFGKNTTSGFGDYTKMATEIATEKLNKVKSGESLSQFEKDQLEYYGRVSGLTGKTNIPGTPIMVGSGKKTSQDLINEARQDYFSSIDTGVDDFTTAAPPVEDFGEITSDAGFTTVPTGPTLGGSFPGMGGIRTTGPMLGESFPGIGVGYETGDDLDEIEGQEVSAGNIMTDASIVDQPISISETLPEGASKTGTPIDSLNPINRQQHFDNVEKLKDAVREGEITEEEYNVISAFDARKTMGLKTVDGLAAALGYQGLQAAVGDQSFGEFVGDTALNLQGVSGNVPPELQVKYQEIVTGQKIYRDPILGMVQEPETGTLAGEPDLPGIGGEADIDLIGEPDIVDTPISDMPDDAGMPEAPTPDIPDRGRGTIAPSPPPRDDDAGMPEAPAPDRRPPTGISGPPSVISRPPSDDGGGGGGGGGGGKIVCTMMNESYGFGSFRNKIWLRHSKGLAPEYQRGYHKIFLPLVKLSKKNYVLKKVLEHIAVHRTIDIRQESRNKVHLLGRIYRKVLEPICYLVGKYGKD